MRVLEQLKSKLGIETKEEKIKRLAFERFTKANFNYVYNRVLKFAKDYELTVNGLLMDEEQLRPRVYNMIDNAIKNGVVHPTTFEICNSLELI